MNHTQREGHSIVFVVFVGHSAVVVVECVVVSVCVWVRGACDYSFGGYWRGVGRVRVLHRCRCGVCVRLGAGCLGVVVGWGRSVFVPVCSRAHQGGRQPCTRRTPGGRRVGVGRSSGGPPHPTGRAAAPHLPPEAPRPRPREGVELRGASGVLWQRGAAAALAQLLRGRRGAGRRRGALLGLGSGLG